MRSKINRAIPEDWSVSFSPAQILDSLNGINRNRNYSDLEETKRVEIGDLDSSDAMERLNELFVRMVKSRQDLNDLPGQLREEV